MTGLDSSATARLFVALWPDDDVRAALVSHADEWSWAKGARRVPPERLHVTTHFLGPVDRSHIEEIADGIDVPCERFEMRLTQPALWPRGVAVLLPGTTSDAAFSLHARLSGELGRMGFVSDRDTWAAHVTLARDAKGSTPPVVDVNIGWVVDGYALVESVMTPTQQEYRVLRRYPAPA
jgi:RNA 2',3'-cyclic 3'-phosphodiesterase